MNNKAFTLVELLGVIIILAIIMIIAVPNVTSVLERTKMDNYIADAKKLVSLVEYNLSSGDLEKPTSQELLKITLSWLNTNDVTTDPDGNQYDKKNSYVVIVRDNGYLEYYVNLVAVDEDNNTRGIKLVNVEELDKDDRYKKIENNIPTINEYNLKRILGLASLKGGTTYSRDDNGRERKNGYIFVDVIGGK